MGGRWAAVQGLLASTSGGCSPNCMLGYIHMEVGQRSAPQAAKQGAGNGGKPTRLVRQPARLPGRLLRRQIRPMQHESRRWRAASQRMLHLGRSTMGAPPPCSALTGASPCVVLVEIRSQERLGSTCRPCSCACPSSLGCARAMSSAAPSCSPQQPSHAAVSGDGGFGRTSEGNAPLRGGRPHPPSRCPAPVRPAGLPRQFTVEARVMTRRESTEKRHKRIRSKVRRHARPPCGSGGAATARP